MESGLYPFWQRRHRITRVVAITLLLPVAAVIALCKGAREEARSLRRELPGMYRDCWRTPRI